MVVNGLEASAPGGGASRVQRDPRRGALPGPQRGRHGGPFGGSSSARSAPRPTWARSGHLRDEAPQRRYLGGAVSFTSDAERGTLFTSSCRSGTRSATAPPIASSPRASAVPRTGTSGAPSHPGPRSRSPSPRSAGRPRMLTVPESSHASVSSSASPCARPVPDPSVATTRPRASCSSRSSAQLPRLERGKLAPRARARRELAGLPAGGERTRTRPAAAGARSPRVLPHLAIEEPARVDAQGGRDAVVAGGYRRRRGRGESRAGGDHHASCFRTRPP